jgi:hypothetical protein
MHVTVVCVTLCTAHTDVLNHSCTCETCMGPGHGQLLANCLYWQ